MREQYDSISDVQLGRGAFGQVELVKRRSDQKTFACKTIFIDTALENEKEAASHEYEIVKKLQHPNIVRYYDAAWTPSKAKLYMEYCEQGSLDTLIERYRRKGQSIPHYYMWSIIYQLASALVYCHEGRKPVGLQENLAAHRPQRWSVILHRDIKPKNVLLSSESMTALDAVKLGDFGLGVVLGGAKDPTTYAGTKIYLPPEIRAGHRFTWRTACDIFSLGCTLFELYHQEPPFDDHAGSSSIEHRPIRAECPDDLRRCILDCMQSDPERRPKAHEILSLARQKLEERPEHFAAVGEHRLLSSSQHGDLDAVVQLLADKTAVNCQDGTDLETPLHRVARADFMGLDIAHLLLVHGADLNAKSKNGETPLHVAAETGHLDVARLLLKAKASTRERDKRDWLAIHTAACRGHNAVVSLLMEMGADKEAFTSDSLRRTPLQIAAANGHYQTVLCLIENKANVHAFRGDGGTALHSGAEGGSTAIIAELLVAGAKQDSLTREGKTALLIAAAEGHAEAVRFLLSAEQQDRKGIRGWPLFNPRNGSQYGLSPVHAATIGDHAAVLEILLENGCSVDGLVRDEVTHAMNNRILAGWAASHIASALGHQRAIEVLLAFKANIDHRTKSLETALHLAAGCGHIGAAKSLIQAGADLEARAFKQLTPLHYAAAQKQEDMIRYLLTEGVDVNARTSNRATALHFAAQVGHAEAIEALMSAGANIDAANDPGKTAFHVAADVGSATVIYKLMRSRIDHREKRDNRGKRAVDIAMERGDDDVIEALGGRR